MNEAALIKIQAKVMKIDMDLLYYITDLIDGRSLLTDDQLTILIESTERELKIYEYILTLIIANTNQN
tara:strand:- start:127 stop:330 length:204 start_codon:yes stop_codon:yes gene_type:complete